MPANPSPVRAEFDRVGASFRKAGAADYISITEDEDAVRLVGPPREHDGACRLSGGRWTLSESRRVARLAPREGREVRSFPVQGGFGGDWHCEVVQQ